MSKLQMGKFRIDDVTDITSFKIVEPSTLKNQKNVSIII